MAYDCKKTCIGTLFSDYEKKVSKVLKSNYVFQNIHFEKMHLNASHLLQLFKIIKFYY